MKLAKILDFAETKQKRH